MEDVLQRIEQKIDAMGGRLESVEVQLGTVDRRLTGLEGGMSSVTVTLGEVQGGLRGVQSGLSGLTETVHQQGLRQEYLIDKVTATMEGLEGGRQVMDKRFDEVMKKLDERVTPIELATRYLATKKEPRRG